MSYEEKTGEYEAPALVAGSLVIFPHMDVVITVGDLKNKAALEAARRERELMVSAPASSSGGVSGNIGVLVHVQESAPDRGGGMRVRLKGLWRVRIEQVLSRNEYTRVRFVKAEEFTDNIGERPEVMRTVLGQIDEFAKLIPELPTSILKMLESAESPGKLADLCAYAPQFTLEERMDLLKTLDPEARLLKISRLFDRELSVLKQVPKANTIPDCETCAELADKAIESDAGVRAEHLSAFLNHVVNEHPLELLALIAEKYGPTFMNKRSLK